jgi:hypothetical protein
LRFAPDLKQNQVRFAPDLKQNQASFAPDLKQSIIFVKKCRDYD